MMNELLTMTARKVVDLLQRKEVSPLELIDLAAQRIAEVDPKINAVPTLCLERAREKAAELMRTRPADAPEHYLYGLPILVKDLTEVKGVRTTYGSTAFADNIPEYSNYLVERLEQNGAVVIGKTNTPEFGAGGNTFNAVFGTTGNPWNSSLTCGGSSGGSAAALASGQIWLATGNDLGGSLRTPASFCSVVGFRPSPGRVACGPSPTIFEPLGIEGPMARTVADAALMLDAQVGWHPDDPISLPRPEHTFLSSALRCQAPKKVAFSADLGIAPVDRRVREICAGAVLAWQSRGVAVEQACPDFRNVETIFQTLRASMLAARLGPLLATHRAHFKPELVWNIEKGLSLTPAEIGAALRLQAQLFHSLQTFFSRYDLLVCPTVVAPPFDARQRYLQTVEGQQFDTYIGWLRLTYAITVTTCPCIAVPCGFTQDGLPVGIQIVGPPRADAQVLSAAANFEELHDLAGRTPIDPRPGVNADAPHAQAT